MSNAAVYSPIEDGRQIGSLLEAPAGRFAPRRTLRLPGTSGEHRDALRAAFGAKPRRLLRRHDHAYLQNETCRSLFMLHSGSVKACITTPGGNEQVLGFHLPGEVFGVDGMTCSRYRCSTIALEHTSVSAFALERLRESSVDQLALAGCVISILAEELSRERTLRSLRNQVDAEHRLCDFLLDWSRRLGGLGYSSTEFQLPMSRFELGSFLGTTAETVCRMFAALREQGMVHSKRRYVEILAPNRLQEHADTIFSA